MKKIMTLAAMFAAVAMTFSACNKEQKPDNGGENNGGTTTETPTLRLFPTGLMI